MQSSGEITRLLLAWREGDPQALEDLIPIVYQELRRVAARYMSTEHQDHTLQTTALVHEAYLRLANEQDRTWQNRAHFFGVAAQIMRNLLVDHARAAGRAKRGGDQAILPLEDVAVIPMSNPEELLALDVALQRLAKFDPRAGRIVELRYFVGLEHSEIAEVLGISETSVKRDWSAAKAWLQTELRHRSRFF